MIKNKPRCSVLIIVKNEPSVALTLEVLREQVEAINGECIVVDASGSALKSIQIANTWAKWIQFDQPLGLNSTISLQRNIAVREAKSGILLFCDAGSIPSNTWVSDLCQELESGSFELVGGPLEFFHNGKYLGKRNFQSYGEEVQYPTCANMGFTRTAYERTSGFNEKLLVAEDDDFAWQLKKIGVANAVIPTAVMQMDLGDLKRRFVRSWRYGKGVVRLLKAHPELRGIRLRNNPDIWLYPILLPVYLGIFFSAIWKPVLLLAPLSISISLILRNFKSKTKLFDHTSHFIYACGSIWEAFKSLFKTSRHATVVQFPHDQSPYLDFLSDSLNSSHPVSIKFPDLTKSASLNVFLLPFLTPVMRIFGIRIINIHWIVGKWQLRWASRPWGRQVLWYWFKVWITSFKLFRMKIVYTVHDLKFHSKVFNNEAKTHEYLMGKADSLVFLNELSKNKILERLPGKLFALIPEGPLDIQTTISNGEMRERLGVAESKKLLVLVGHLQEYKGIDLLFPAAEIMPENFAIRIAGVCTGGYRDELEALATRAHELGVDIELDARGLSDEEFSGYLHCADYFLYPCRDINNSGSLNAALTANLPVIVPDMPELNWVLPECKVVMQKTSEATLDFKECFGRISNMSPDTYQDLKNGTELWKSERSWKKVSEKYTSLYRGLLDG